MKQVELTKEERKKIAKEAYANPVYFCRFFLRKWFPTPMPWVHRGLLAILCRKCDFLQNDPEIALIMEHFSFLEDPDDEESRRHYVFHFDTDGILHMTLQQCSLVKMPRGFSKTTIANAANLYAILYEECRHLLYVSEAYPHACMQLGTVKAELETNPRILSVFGVSKPPEREGRIWSADMIVTVKEVIVSARGRGGQVRGIVYKSQRPDRINVDDVEDKESVSTDEQRKKVKQWAYGDLLPALAELDPDATLVAMGTLLHKEALLQTWEKDPEFTAITFSAVLPDGTFLWPFRMDGAKFERKKVQFATAGQLSVFYMEYCNEIRADELQKFKQEYFIYQPFKDSEFIAKAIAFDPAIGEDEESCYRAITVVGLTERGQIPVLDVWYDQKADTYDQIEAYFARVKRWKMVDTEARCFFGVETQSFQKALISPMKVKMFETGIYFPITEQKHKKAKEERVQGALQPRFKSGHIYFTRRFPLLETQLLDWPNGKKDLPDVLAMAVDLLSPLAPTFSSENDDLADDDYPPLEEVFDGDWRQHPEGNSLDAVPIGGALPGKPGARFTRALRGS